MGVGAEAGMIIDEIMVDSDTHPVKRPNVIQDASRGIVAGLLCTDEISIGIVPHPAAAASEGTCLSVEAHKFG